MVDQFLGGAGLLYLIALPVGIAWDGWQDLHACSGHPCGIYQDMVLKSPLKSRPRINLGRAYFLKGRLDLALREYQQAELNAMNEPEPAHTLGGLLASVNIADLFIQQNRWDDAHEILKEGWLRHPHFSGFAINLSLYYLTRNPPEAAKAEVFLSDAIRHIHDFPFAEWELGTLYYNRAIAEGLLGRCVGMKRDLWKVRRLDPDLPAADVRCFEKPS